MRRTIEKEIEVPEGVTVEYKDRIFSAKGPKGEVTKRIYFPVTQISIENGLVKVVSENAGKKEKKIIGTVVAHIKNIIKGAEEGFVYKLKICSGHFPMNVSVSGNKFSVKNLLGEKVPRELTLKEGATVKIDGSIITVESNDKETAGQVSADIEQLTRRPGFDRRIFQDGIYIIEKNGKAI